MEGLLPYFAYGPNNRPRRGSAVPHFDVKAHIPVGTTRTLFELRDFGAIAGNTDLFLVTGAIVSLPSRLIPSLGALNHRFGGRDVYAPSTK
jgi:hypothetical protein